MSLQKKIVLWLTAIQLVTYLILISSSAAYLHQQAMHHVTKHAENVLLLIKAAVAESMFVVNLNSANEVIDSAFYEIENISFLKLTDENGKIISKKQKGSDLLHGSIELKDTVELGGITFGTLYMRFSTGPMNTFIMNQTMILVLASMISAIILSSASYFVINRLAKTIDQVECSINDIVENNVINNIDDNNSLTNLVTAYNKLVDKCSSTEYFLTKTT